jgi:pimeloyl-ACP methyl ester carboxylesterase
MPELGPLPASRPERRRRRSLFFAVAGTCVLLLVSLLGSSVSAGATTDAAPAAGAYTTSTVLLGKAQVIGALYQPSTPGPNQSTALFLTHENSDFIGSVPCVQLAQRGYTVLCVKSQYADQAAANWDALALDVGAGVGYLRSLPTVRKVVLVGWSGGGAIMSYYQNVAQNGLAACQSPARLDPCGDDLAGLPPADGVVLLDAIPGIAFSDLTALDASVTNEQNLRERDGSRDMFDPRNGYNPKGDSAYSQTFVDRYLAGQGKREDGLIAQAQKLSRQTAEGKGQYSNDAPMPVGRDSARLWEADASLLSHTRGKYPVLSPQHPNGGPPQVVHSVRVSSASADSNERWDSSKGGFTAGSFLSVAAIRAPHLRITADSIGGIDWSSTNTATVNNVRGISSPLLIMSMTGHYWLVPSEMYYDNAVHAKNKQLVFVEGATHGFTPCTACATTPGQFGDTVTETFDYVSTWLSDNFGH